MVQCKFTLIIVPFYDSHLNKRDMFREVTTLQSIHFETIPLRTQGAAIKDRSYFLLLLGCGILWMKLSLIFVFIENEIRINLKFVNRTLIRHIYSLPIIKVNLSTQYRKDSGSLPSAVAVFTD